MEIGGCNILQQRANPLLPGAGGCGGGYEPIPTSFVSPRYPYRPPGGDCWKGDTRADGCLGLFWGDFGCGGGSGRRGRVKAGTLHLPTAHCLRSGVIQCSCSSWKRSERGWLGEGRMAWGHHDLLPAMGSPGLGENGRTAMQPPPRDARRDTAGITIGIPNPGADPGPDAPTGLAISRPRQHPGVGGCPFSHGSLCTPVPHTGHHANQDQRGAPAASTAHPMPSSRRRAPHSALAFQLPRDHSDPFGSG